MATRMKDATQPTKGLRIRPGAGFSGLSCVVFDLLILLWFVGTGISGLDAQSSLRPLVFRPTPTVDPHALSLIWDTKPGWRYEVQRSTDLRSWSIFGAEWVTAQGLVEQVPVRATAGQEFFRLRPIDEQPPTVTVREPSPGAFGVQRWARLVVAVEDRSGVDPASIKLKVGGLGVFALSGGDLIFTNNLLLFNSSKALAWGAFGEKIDVSLTLADKLGNRGTNAWQFELELEPDVVTNLFVFGSDQAQRLGQAVVPADLSGLDAHSPAPAGRDAKVTSWRLVQVGPDRLVTTYADDLASAIPAGTLVCNLAPANTNEIFYREVISFNNDPAAQKLTIFTKEAPLERFVRRGSIGVSSNSRWLDVQSDGAIPHSVSVGEQLQMPRVGVSLDGEQFVLKDKIGFDLVKLRAKALHWWLLPEVRGALSIADAKVQRFQASIQGSLQSSMILDFEVVGIGMNNEQTVFDLASTQRPQRWVYLGSIGPVPIFASLKFDLEWRVTPEAGALHRSSAGVRLDAGLDLALQYQDARTDFKAGLDLRAVDIESSSTPGTGELRLGFVMSPRMEFEVLGLAGMRAHVTENSSLVFAASGAKPLQGRMEAGRTVRLEGIGAAFEGLDPKPFMVKPLWQDEWILFPVPAALTLVTQPRNTEARLGETVRLNCSAIAPTPLDYQWHYRGVPLPWQNTRTLQLSNVTADHGGEYFVRIRAGAETRDSDVIKLTVGSNAEELPPPGMSLIPAGSFQMGDSFNDWIVSPIERPVHTVFVSAFYMDQHEVTKALWDKVELWSKERGYAFSNQGAARAPDHPVQTVSWYDVVKWCNARSEMEGLAPAYYTDAALTQVYKTEELAPFVKWNVGYRLPTEAEWEKAARGGANGQRFPWVESDTITHDQANYYSNSAFPYDISRTRGLHPKYENGDFTSPIGSFQANGYGLYDMAGNVWEWCWDWQDWYTSDSQTDPRGPATGTYRVVRGGGWYREAIYSRVAFRGNGAPDFRGGGSGFRSVLSVHAPKAP